MVIPQGLKLPSHSLIRILYHMFPINTWLEPTYDGGRRRKPHALVIGIVIGLIMTFNIKVLEH